jgi:hypothetical protein
LIDDNLMVRAKSDVEMAFKAWKDYATQAGDRNDAEVARGTFDRVAEFFKMVESDEELLFASLAALTLIETIVNQDADDEQAISFQYERIHDAAGSVLVRTR